MKRGARSVECGAPMNASERWLTVNDVAARLGIKPRTASLWARRGRIPAYRVGRYLRFRWEEVEAAMVARCRVGAGKEAV
jgi:excisionase family DNA binding protein